jgi:hypothetical protein
VPSLGLSFPPANGKSRVTCDPEAWWLGGWNALIYDRGQVCHTVRDSQALTSLLAHGEGLSGKGG